jgi:hypothetical protein
MKKRVVNTLYYIFFISAILLFLYRMYLRSNNHTEEAERVQWVIVGLLLAGLICRFMPRLFPKWFHDKPTREEAEKEVHNE